MHSFLSKVTPVAASSLGLSKEVIDAPKREDFVEIAI